MRMRILSNFCHCPSRDEQSTDLEIPCGDIETVGEISPIVKVATDLPVLVAVVYDKEVASLCLGSCAILNISVT